MSDGRKRNLANVSTTTDLAVCTTAWPECSLVNCCRVLRVTLASAREFDRVTDSDERTTHPQSQGQGHSRRVRHRLEWFTIVHIMSEPSITLSFAAALSRISAGTAFYNFTSSVVSTGKRRWQTKRCWYVPTKLGADWKPFGVGSIDGLGMFSGLTTYSMTLLKRKCWARLLGVEKWWIGVIAWYDGIEEIMDSWRFNLRQIKMETG